MNSRRSPSGPELPTVIGQFGAQTIAANSAADVTLSGIPRVFPGDPMIVANGTSGTPGSLPMNARSINPGEVIVTIWNPSGVGVTLSSPLVFKVILL